MVLAYVFFLQRTILKYFDSYLHYLFSDTATLLQSLQRKAHTETSVVIILEQITLLVS